MSSHLYPQSIEGRDILDSDPNVNPSYWNYNFVLLPYCTSDLWIGNSTWNESEAEKARAPFQFDFHSKTNQFAFRGSAVFRAAIRELLLYHDLSAAEDVVLAGSSAGGIGVINQAGWLRRHLSSSTSLSAIIDSAWFVNFNNKLVEKFNLEFSVKEIKILSHPPCNDFSTLGFPCCISAQCMLSKDRLLRQSDDFPDIPMFVIFSLYDLFILSDSVRDFENHTSDVQHLETFRTVTEYGGAMNVSLENSRAGAPKMSYFVPSCLQHVYLATSSLRDRNGMLDSNFDSSNYDGVGNGDTALFKFMIRPDTWSKIYVKSQRGMNERSIQCAIHEWNRRIRNTTLNLSLSHDPVRHIDTCFGARCNGQCPEVVRLGVFGDTWVEEVQYFITGLILFVTFVCVLYKLVMIWRKVDMLQCYHMFIEHEKQKTAHENEGMPHCSPQEAVGVACLNLRYSISLSKEALAETKKTQQRKIAEEEESRALLGLTGSNHNTLESKKKQEDSASSITEETKTTLKQLFCCCGKKLKLPQSPSSQRLNPTKEKDNMEMSVKERRQKELESLEKKSSQVEFSFPSLWAKEMANSAQESRLEKFEKRDSVQVSSTAVDATLVESTDSATEKTILHDISAYFNPGELVAIMGPSGSGKTTLLDLLTGRRKTGNQTGNVFINGLPFQRLREWYVRHTGYVLQLAVPYYEELTVQQNLWLSAFIRLPKSLSQLQRFRRVKEVIEETGLSAVKDTVVGGSTGPGLSGGQKRRLAVAIQLLSMPKVIFLDEPTSGLDASSSMELLQHLRYVAMSGRLVIMTIHQPRVEIFHIFDRILFLCQGEVAYYGSPIEAPGLFLKAYQVARLEGEAPVLGEGNNPADIIMDMLGSRSHRAAILNYYKTTTETKSVKNAIELAKNTIEQAKRDDAEKEDKNKNVHSESGSMNRFFAMETRAEMRASLAQSLYLPVIFLLFALVAGLAYLQADSMLLIMAAFSIHTFASSIFMFPAIYFHLSKGLEMHRMERADGVGKSIEVLSQTFFRYVAISFLPLVGSSLIVCLMVLQSQFWTLKAFFYVIIITLALNQTWTSAAMMLICLFPVNSHKISPLVSCAAGFAAGFLIPPSEMKIYFRWLLYINPNYYGYSSMMRLLLPDIETGCNFQSTIECYPNTGKFWLEDFGLHDIEPFLHLMILLIMTGVAFIAAWLALEFQLSPITLKQLFLRMFCVREGERDAGDDDGEWSDVDENEEAAGGSVKDVHKGISRNRKAQRGHKRGRKYSDAEDPSAPMSTHSTLVPTGDHTIFSPSAATTSDTDHHLTFCRMSVRDRRREIAVASQQKRISMLSTISTFEQMHRRLEKNVTDVNAMKHVVPIERLARRVAVTADVALKEEEEEDDEPKVEYENLK
ncbi:uncharacterized protein LOC134198639 isoform X2 [Corticium candelabrum]|uniref:uncharacterized protein LOC134198639 isoform X2 n=1 Tax=Corticium candelabrum TaxID=121492 RepID=UPI002E26F6C3|nr:uncharacterized protein LOC134198639 isoform X2 [Corticium candelabrum]